MKLTEYTELLQNFDWPVVWRGRRAAPQRPPPGYRPLAGVPWGGVPKECEYALVGGVWYDQGGEERVQEEHL